MRNLFALALLATIVVGPRAVPAPAYAQRTPDVPVPCAWARDIRLVNGRIHTMDSRNAVVSEVTIQQGRVAAVGADRNLRPNPCTRTIDLRGRTAVPGLIDNHNHIVLLGMRPGHDLRLDRVFSIASRIDWCSHGLSAA